MDDVGQYCYNHSNKKLHGGKEKKKGIKNFFKQFKSSKSVAWEEIKAFLYRETKLYKSLVTTMTNWLF